MRTKPAVTCVQCGNANPRYPIAVTCNTNCEKKRRAAVVSPIYRQSVTIRDDRRQVMTGVGK